MEDAAAAAAAEAAAAQEIEDIQKYFENINRIEITEDTYFGTTIPRDATLSDLCDAANNVLGIPETNVSSQSWELPCLFNGSGAGKTFINFYAKFHIHEYLTRNQDMHPELRQTMQHSYRVYFKQVNGLSYQTFCKDLKSYVEPSIKSYLLWTIASQLLLPQEDNKLHRSHIDMFGKEMKRLEDTKFWATLTYTKVLKALRQKYGIQGAIWIFMSHDELQFLTDYETLLNVHYNPTNKPSTLLYQYLMEVIAFAEAAKQQGINVLNIFSGTFRLEVINILSPTRHSWRRLKFEPLTVEDGLKLMISKHPALKEQMEKPTFKRNLAHLGNIPRIWRLFSEIIAKEAKPKLDGTNLAQLNELLKEKVRMVYATHSNLDLLLLLALQGWTFNEASAVLPSEQIKITTELLNEGLLFLINEHFFVPPILLQSITSNSQITIKRLLTETSNRILSGTFTAAEFEEFVLGFFTLKRNLMVSLGICKISMAVFFNGAWFAPNAQDRELFLAEEKSPMTIYKVQTACLNSLQTVHVGDKETLNAIKEAPIALWIGNNDPHQDAIILLPKGQSIQFEMKYSVTGGQKSLEGKSSSSFQNEQMKAESSPLRVLNGPKLFVYATNCKMTANKEKRERVQHDSSIIICADNFTSVFSPTFEYLTKHIQNEECEEIDEPQKEEEPGEEELVEVSKEEKSEEEPVEESKEEKSEADKIGPKRKTQKKGIKPKATRKVSTSAKKRKAESDTNKRDSKKQCKAK